ncbi:PTS fructose transporter subunit IIBC, partial [Xanthomonas vesicatoria]
MSSSIVVIAAGERSTEAVLAAEALRRAATAAGRSVTIEIRSDQGVLGALPTELTNGAAQVLIVGDADADTARFGDAQLLHLSLGALLDDP